NPTRLERSARPMPSRLRAISSMMAKARASDCTPPRGWPAARAAATRAGPRAAFAELCLLCAFTVTPPAWLFRGYRIRKIALAEDRLLVRRRRQLPGAGRRRTDFRIDMHIKHVRLVGLDRVFEGALEVLRFRHCHCFDARCACPGRKIGVVGFVVRPFVEHRAVLAATEHAELDVADRHPAEIIPDHPDHGDIVLDSGA